MTDNCPNGDRKAVPPIAEHIGGNQISHLYQCAGCGHTWSTNRDLRAYGQDAA